jgi:hypothetical protein
MACATGAAFPRRPPAVNDLLIGVLRHLLTSAGAILVAKGYIEDGLAEQLVGGGVALASLASMAWAKRQAAAKTQALKAEATNAQAEAVGAKAVVASIASEAESAKAEAASLGAHLESTRSDLADLVAAVRKITG